MQPALFTICLSVYLSSQLAAAQRQTGTGGFVVQGSSKNRGASGVRSRGQSSATLPPVVTSAPQPDWSDADYYAMYRDDDEVAQPQDDVGVGGQAQGKLDVDFSVDDAPQHVNAVGSKVGPSNGLILIPNGEDSVRVRLPSHRELLGKLSENDEVQDIFSGVPRLSENARKADTARTRSSVASGPTRSRTRLDDSAQVGVRAGVGGGGGDQAFNPLGLVSDLVGQIQSNRSQRDPQADISRRIEQRARNADEYGLAIRRPRLYAYFHRH